MIDNELTDIISNTGCVASGLGFVQAFISGFNPGILTLSIAILVFSFAIINYERE